MQFGFEAIISIIFLLFSFTALFFAKHPLDRIISLIILALLTIITICKMVVGSEQIQGLIFIIACFMLVITYLFLKQNDRQDEEISNSQNITYIIAICIFLSVFTTAAFLSQHITTLSTISEKQKLAKKDDKFLNSFKTSSFGIAIHEVGGSVSQSKDKQDHMAKKNRGEFKMNQNQRKQLRNDLSDSFLLKGFSEFILLLVAFFTLNIFRKSKSNHESL